MNNKKIMIGQIGILIIIGIALYFIYPKTEINVNGNFVRFNSINAKVIMISENPDFSNPRYLDMDELDNVSFKLNPGTYYWKSDNGIIKGLENKFVVKSEVGLGINKSEENAELVNIGNVKLNVTKGEGGAMVGHIILEPDESEEIKDEGEYIGRETR